MNIIFCSDDLDRRKPDEAYAAEVAAFERVGGQHFLINFDALVSGPAVSATSATVTVKAAAELFKVKA